MHHLPQRLRLLVCVLCTLPLLLNTVFAQTLDQVFVSPEGSFAFRYPASWSVSTDSDLFVLTTNGDIRIEFYYQDVAGMFMNLEGDPARVVGVFQDVMGTDTASASGTISMGRPISSLQTALNLAAPTTRSGVPLLIAGRAVVGQLEIAGGRGEYIFVVRGDLMDDPGYTFVRVTGSARSLIADQALILSIIDSFGSLVAPDEFGPAPSLPTATLPPALPSATPMPTATPTATPCTVRATGEGETSVHVGPGNNRTIIRFLATGREFEVIGTAEANDGSQWWRLDKEEAAPSQALQVNETWVAAREVTQRGDCDRVGTVAPPPIIPLPPTAAPATAAPSPEAVDGGNITISFIADRNPIVEGECVNLIWDVRGARQVIWQGAPYAAQALFTVCPMTTTTYELVIVPFEGPNITRSVTVNVGPPTEADDCTFDELPAFISDSIPTGGSDVWSFSVDPCRSPSTIVVEMYATDSRSSLDPYLEVTVFFADGRSAFYSNDDYSESLDAVVFIPAAARITRISVTARSFANYSGGNYNLSVERVTSS